MRVSVIMPVYNSERFLSEAVESVLDQTFSDFEFIIINDGSSDRSEEILKHYKNRDSRIVLASQANCGVAASLNRAIAISTSSLLARMDGDDRALPCWLQKQIDFLDQNSECSVVSSYAYFINSAGKRIGKAGNPVNVERGWAEMNPSHFLNIIHPTVLMRKRDVLTCGAYREGCVGPEDRELWGRMVTAGKMIRCNPEPLIEYRLHGESISAHKLKLSEEYLRHSIDVNVVRRMRGEVELSPVEVEEWFRSRPYWEQFNQRLIFYYGQHFRDASRHYANSQWLKFIRTFGIAAAIRPVYTLQRVTKKVSLRS
jgi:glycosyltransferase involved in cell wall biosynthesis